MGVVISKSLVLSETIADEFNANNPLIGWHNLVTVDNLRTDNPNTTYPEANLANPSTALRWFGSDTSETVITVNHNTIDPIDYVGIADHNFGSAQIGVGLYKSILTSNTVLLLNFNGEPGSDTLDDSSLNPKQVFGEGGFEIVDGGIGFRENGGFNGVDSSVIVVNHPDLDLGDNDFTIQCVFGASSGSPADRGFAGQMDDVGSGSAAGSAWSINYTATDQMEFRWSDGSSFHSLTGASVIVPETEYHLRITRSGDTFRLFLNGVLDAITTVSGSINSSDAHLHIGRRSEVAANYWGGLIDDFEIIRGVALSSTDDSFDPPEIERPWAELVAPAIPADDAPLLIRFEPESMPAIRVNLLEGLEPPTAAVLYVGKLLVLQRRIYVGHKPMLFNESVDNVVGMSDRGQYLGDVVLSSWNSGSIQQNNVTPSFFRTYVDPWRVQGLRTRQPFFFAWRPGDYPREVAYCWPQRGSSMDVSNQLPNGFMSFSLSVQGIVS